MNTITDWRTEAAALLNKAGYFTRLESRPLEDYCAIVAGKDGQDLAAFLSLKSVRRWINAKKAQANR